MCLRVYEQLLREIILLIEAGTADTGGGLVLGDGGGEEEEEERL